ncbi:hypothetical protein H4S08_000059 [Coemansia sp. RSA 1365]|nr:hypothetical protein H4S08_000059 [Coemansia sp. RSA 1365]
MSEDSAWNQLFRINPDYPQTPMLSSQELQEELALWSNAQFQLEPVGAEHTKGIESTYKSRNISEQTSQQQSQHQNTWGFLDLAPQKQGSHVQYSTSQPSAANGTQINPLSFMMDAASTSDIINAITSPSAGAHSQWAQLAQQQQQPLKMASFGEVPMVPFVPLSQQPTAQPAVSPAITSGKVMAIAPSSTTKQLHHTPIVPKSAASSDLFQTSGVAASVQLSALRKAAAKTRSPVITTTAAATQASEAGTELKEQSEDEDDEEDNTQRKTAAEEDKRRRNTAASARFRIKKKLKEQALERTAREMSEKAETLEKRVQELEVETRWLKSLITERDPDVLNNVRCPCHHPNGLEGEEEDISGKLLASTSAAPRRTVTIAPSPSSGPEPPLKKSKI